MYTVASVVNPHLEIREMARTKFIAGNWKMNTSKASAVALAKSVAAGGAKSGVEVGVAPPFVYLDLVGQALAGSNVMLGRTSANCPTAPPPARSRSRC